MGQPVVSYHDESLDIGFRRRLLAICFNIKRSLLSAWPLKASEYVDAVMLRFASL